MTYDALRQGRVSIPGTAYLLTTVTADRQTLFGDFDCARCAIRELRRLDEQQRCTTMAWVLMPDHLHWLMTLHEGARLAELMRDFKGRSARAINRMRKLSGPVWQRAFHDHAVRDDEDVRRIARYIAANPLRAGLVKDIGQYPHWDAIWLP